MVSHRFAVHAVLLPLLAAACTRRQQAFLKAADVAGCYQFVGPDDHPLASPSGFWSAPVRLDTALAPVDGDGGYTVRPGYYSLTPTAHIPLEAAIDTAMFRAGWEIQSPDTLLVTRSTGFIGQTIRLQPQAHDFAGVTFWTSDVVDSTRRPQMDSVLARRIPCPAAT